MSLTILDCTARSNSNPTIERILYRVFTALITVSHETATRSISNRKFRTCFGRSVLIHKNSFSSRTKQRDFFPSYFLPSGRVHLMQCLLKVVKLFHLAASLSSDKLTRHLAFLLELLAFARFFQENVYL